MADIKEKKIKETKVKKTVKKPSLNKEKKIKLKYFEEVGRRKTSIARVRLEKNGKEFVINGKSWEKYFTTEELRQNIMAPLEITDYAGKFSFSVKVKGGGISSQSDAVRHGIARALILIDPDLRKKLKKAGYLKRDPRMRERKKFGLKRARRAPQWKKR
jgi:small subunit ribosomal protein S9